MTVNHEKPIKLVVWDLDLTLWDGTLLEGDTLRLNHDIARVIEALDGRGVLQSIASRNEPESAHAQLRKMGIEQYFLCPQIGWWPKSESIRRITEKLNLGLDSVLFIDDQQFEREEVAHAHPAVRTLDALAAPTLLDDERFPVHASPEGRRRRVMYVEDFVRRQSEENFTGPPAAFLASLQLTATIQRARAEDLDRVEELTIRTNQLNSTGLTYSRAELMELSGSATHELRMIGLQDRFGDYGQIGLALMEKGASHWTLKLLLLSCRVMSRGIGGIVISYILQLARAAAVELRAEFRSTGRNRAMLIAYRFANFREVGRIGDVATLAHDLIAIPEIPAHVTIVDQFEAG